MQNKLVLFWSEPNIQILIISISRIYDIMREFFSNQKKTRNLPFEELQSILQVYAFKYFQDKRVGKISYTVNFVYCKWHKFSAL